MFSKHRNIITDRASLSQRIISDRASSSQNKTLNQSQIQQQHRKIFITRQSQIVHQTTHKLNYKSKK